ncbi:type 2 periplasmic-binding domain-containing protein [Bordetella ansorpii]|uniref:transporter substrate-binding domain-containing protein n=1 Tax=Bordetella ansorpii TaxID=288768 RepID=UPI00082954B4|nr:transporter substrate-binding domain-containing protein [Bordetella ansorpii]
MAALLAAGGVALALVGGTALATAWRTGDDGLADRLPESVQRWLETLARQPDWRARPLGPVLQQARARGTLVVAVRAYPRPAPPGSQPPSEPDDYDAALARYLADTLDVPLRLVNLPATDEKRGALEALTRPRADLILAGTRYGMPAGNDTPVSGGGAIATEYVTGRAALLALRGAADAWQAAASPAGRNVLARRSVCVQQGSPYADSLQATYQARPRAYPSSVHAAYAFMSGECEVLAEDEAVLQRLLAREEWRFYRRLPIDIVPDARQPQIVLAQADPVSARYVDQAVRYWKASGALRQARAQRVGQVNLEVTALQDGLVCHS